MSMIFSRELVNTVVWRRLDAQLQHTYLPGKAQTFRVAAPSRSFLIGT